MVASVPPYTNHGPPLTGSRYTVLIGTNIVMTIATPPAMECALCVLYRVFYGLKPAQRMLLRLACQVICADGSLR